MPAAGTVFISVKDRDKTGTVEIARRLTDLGFKLVATGGTQRFLADQGLAVERINKVLEGRPHCEDAIVNGDIHLVINTTEGSQAIEDSRSIRRSALENGVPHYTTLTAAAAAVEAMEAMAHGTLEVAPLQDYFSQSY